MNKKTILILGDVIALVVLTVIGFISHGESDISFVPRMGTTFLPFFIGWFLLAPWFGLFDENLVSNPKLLWRVPLAILFAAPLATILRAAMFNTAALPIFTLVIGLTFALGMFIWRAGYLFFMKHKPS